MLRIVYQIAFFFFFFIKASRISLDAYKYSGEESVVLSGKSLANSRQVLLKDSYRKEEKKEGINYITFYSKGRTEVISGIFFFSFLPPLLSLYHYGKVAASSIIVFFPRHFFSPVFRLVVLHGYSVIIAIKLFIPKFYGSVQVALFIG